MYQNKKHIVLAGDSIFDNQSYVPGQPDVAKQLKNYFGGNVDVTLLAIDGDITVGVEDQLKRLPAETSHLFISVGGNDALNIANGGAISHYDTDDVEFDEDRGSINQNSNLNL